MPHTYANLLIHAVFSTKNRAPLIAADRLTRVHEYLAGLARGEFGVALQVGGVSNHVHGLLSLRPSISVSDAMSCWKSRSSGWIKETFPDLGDFAWQVGYAAFSVSPSSAPKVVAYIARQGEHHRVRTFEEEYLAFLEKHGIAFDPKTVWL